MGNKKVVLKLSRSHQQKWQRAAAVATLAKGTTSHYFDKVKGELTVEGDQLLNVPKLIKFVESGGSRRFPRIIRSLLRPFYNHKRVKVEDVLSVVTK